MSKIISTNPAKDYAILGEIDFSTEEEVIEKVKAAHGAKENWRDQGIKSGWSSYEPLSKPSLRDEKKLPNS